MSSIVVIGGRRFLLASCAALVVCLGLPAGAFATTRNANCSNFGTTLAGASSNDTIVLTGMCTGADAHFTLPAGVSNLTIEGATTGANGFDGSGVTAPALLSGAGGTDGLTLQNLTFENYSSENGVRLTSVTTTATNPFTFSGDTFSNDSAPSGANGDGGGLSLTLDPSSCSFPEFAVTLTGSTFSHDSAPGSHQGGQDLWGGGGAAYLDIECGGTTAPSVAVTNNVFDHNTLAASGRDAEGGGLWLGEQELHHTGIPPLALTQTGNTFTNNSITGGGFDYSGGGEFTAGAIFSSNRDRFSDNSLPGPSDPAVDSEGSAFSSLIGGGCPGVTSSATNLIAAGNTIGAASNGGTGDGVEGAIHPYCNAGGSYDLTLINSTVTANAALGAETDAVAGIDAAGGDHLHLKNSIVYGNSGGTQIDGFGTYAVDHSDVCDFPPNSNNPFAGTGNICADPKLVNASTGDVHETSLSPTVDAGDNTNVPGGTTTDVYGNHRIQPGQVGAAPVVDIGADELHLATPTVTDCSDLQTTLNAAQPGDVITLQALCTSTNSGSSNGSFILNNEGYTLQGASSGTNGFDGTGATGPALENGGTGITLRNLTVENYSLTENAAVALDAGPGRLPVIDHDRFLNNTDTWLFGLGAGLKVIGGLTDCSTYTGQLTITNSTFTGNEAVATGNSSNFAFGPAVAVEFSCSAAHAANVLMSENTFRSNSISTAGAPAYGGAVYLGNASDGRLRSQQSNNVFASNSITATGTASGSYNGGGEWLASVDLVDTGDRFTGNSLPGPAGAGAASSGAGFGDVRAACGPTPTTPVTATMKNVAATGNVIGAPSGGGSVEGAGLYAGVACTSERGTGGFHLTVQDSTVSGNSGPGGAAGIDGESGDTLVLQNSIVNGDTGTGASEIEGFGAGITAAFSDVCATANSTTPFTGTGNICKTPKLLNTTTGDVHETSASPTIDAGSNALVPGLSVDFYGAPRIVATRTCTPKVDIGAAEFQTHASPCPPLVAPKTIFHGAKAKGKGVAVTLSCIRHATGPCRGKISLKTIVHRPKGSHKGPKTKTISVGSKTYAVPSGAKKTLEVLLNRTGRKLLSQHGKLTVTVTVVQSVSHKHIVIAKHKLTIKAPHKKKKK